MTIQNHFLFLVVVILIGSVGLVGTDIYIPALPEMANYFNCNQSEIQTSFTVFLLGLAASQLTTGILADKFGQRRVAVLGFSLLILASIGCAFASSLSEFIAFRFMQAIGGGVGSVMSRAVVVNRFRRQEAIKTFSTTLPLIGLSSAIAPLIGGYLTYYFGWRSNFFFMIIFGITVLLLAIFCLNNENSLVSEAKDPQPDPHKDLHKGLHSAAHLQSNTQTLSRLQGYKSILINIEFLSFAFLVCAGFCVFRSFTAESPFVFNNQGFGPEEIGHFYIALSLAYLAGNMTAKRLVNKFHLFRVLKVGICSSVLGGLLLILATWGFGESPMAVIIPMSVVTFGNGFLYPISTAGAMTSVPGKYSGAASGFMGAIQFVTAAACINWVGKVCQGEVIPMSLFIGAIILIGLMCYLFLISRPEPRLTPTV